MLCLLLGWIAELPLLVHLLELLFVFLSIVLVPVGMLLDKLQLELADQIFLDHEGQAVLDALDVVRVELGGVLWPDDVEDGADEAMTAGD